jgi:imidazolonepropionase-like amidohydrolase
MRLASPLARSAVLGVSLLAAGTVPARAQSGTWALINAKIETATKGTIEKGTIVIRDGLIEAVGPNVTPPADARVVDLTNRVVYPGLIDLTSSIGIPAPVVPQGGRGGGGGGGGGGPNAGGPQAEPQFVGLEPGRVIAGELKPTAAEIRAARDAGITDVLVAPSRGVFRGQSALMPLRDDSATGYVVKSPVAVHMGFQGVSGRYPATLLGVIAYERQALYDAQNHAALLDRMKSGGRGVARPSYDADLDALVPVVRGTVPAFFAASNENEIRRAVAIAKEFKLKLAVVGAQEGFRAIDALKGVPVVVSVEFPQAPSVTGWEYRGAQRVALNDSATRDAAVKKLLEGNAAALNQAGIKFALASGALRGPEFIAGVRKAIAAGLPRDVALQALTIRAAEIAGADQQLGSIEPGKIANLVVSEGEPLTDAERVRMVFVDGARYEIVGGGRATGGANVAGRGARGGTAAAAGVWAMTVTSPQGTQSATLTLTQDGETLDGTMASQMGTLAITDGRVIGNQVSWSISMQINSQATTIAFEGTIDGTRMTGRANMGTMGSLTFTAEKRP